MSAIFISYRREDTEGHTGRLFEALEAHFGQGSVFMDVAGIKPGRDFRKAIDSNVAICDALLAVIGKGWLSAKDDRGQRRLDDANDFVRLETIAALKRDIPVIPVLVQSALMPRKEQLPPEMEDLAYRNAVELSHARWASDVQVLIQALDELVKKPTDPAPGVKRAAKKAAPAPNPAATTPQAAPQTAASMSPQTPAANALAMPGQASPADAAIGRSPSFKWAVGALAVAGLGWGGYETYQRQAEKTQAEQVAQQKRAQDQQEETRRQADLAIAQANEQQSKKWATEQRDKTEKAARDEAAKRDAELKAQEEKNRQQVQSAQTQAAQAQAQAQAAQAQVAKSPTPPKLLNLPALQPVPLAKSLPPNLGTAAVAVQHLVIPYPANGQADSLAHLLSDKLRLPGQAEIPVESKPGMAGDVGAQAVAQSAADGKTLLVTLDSVVTINPGLYQSAANFDPAKTLEVLGLIAYLPSLLVVADSSPLKSVADLVALGRQRRLNFGFSGVGSSGHLTSVYFGGVAKLNTQYLMYNGLAQTQEALVGGQADAAFVVLPLAMSLVKSGKLRALAVSTNRRLAQFPAVPTLAESGYANFDIKAGYMVLAPAKTPADVKADLAQRITAAVQQPDFQARLVELGLSPSLRVGAKSAADWATDYRLFWSSIMKNHNISATH